MKTMQALRIATAAVLAAATSSAIAQSINWPDLPKTGFISGRAATPEEAATGRAPFSLGATGYGPVAVTIPQYVYYKDDNGRRRPAILLQAEKGPRGLEFAAVRDLDGSKHVVPFPDLVLLGTSKPRH